MFLVEATVKKTSFSRLSFRFLNSPREKCAVCAQKCAQTVYLKRVARGRYKALVQLHLASKATVWTGGRLTTSLSSVSV